MSDRYEYHSHCVFNLGYHIIFCPKYRRKVLQWGIDERLKILLVEKATKMGCRIEKMEVMPDHVHIFIKTQPTVSIDNLVQGLKGYTSYILRREYPWLRKMKCLWSPSYYVESIGHISEETVRRYIEDQKETANKKLNKAGSLSSHG